MANYFEKTNLNPQRFVTITSRYLESDVVYYTDRKLLTFSTYKKTDIPNKSTDRFMLVTKGVEYRPDLVSAKAYGVPDFWWKILEANNMKDIWEFQAGVNVRIPDALF
jgi:hypothetical protein